MNLIARAALVAGIMLLAATPSWAKTADCNAEYKAIKAAIRGTENKADFMAACEAGTETIPGGAAAAPVAPPVAAPAAPAFPAIYL